MRENDTARGNRNRFLVTQSPSNKNTGGVCIASFQLKCAPFHRKESISNQADQRPEFGLWARKHHHRIDHLVNVLLLYQHSNGSFASVISFNLMQALKSDGKDLWYLLSYCVAVSKLLNLSEFLFYSEDGNTSKSCYES